MIIYCVMLKGEYLGFMPSEIISGIYCIENLVNGKRYIGQSENIYERICTHKSRLHKNKHGNQLLRRAWNKYGEENFKFYILEKCSKDKLNELEIKYIEKYKTNNKKYGYNFTSGGNVGTKVSKETKKKLSKIFSGKGNNQFGISPKERMSPEVYEGWIKKQKEIRRDGENNPNFGNTKLSKIYAKDKEYAKEKQSRPGIQNGRCLPVAMYDDNGFYLEFDYMSLCAEYMVKNNICRNKDAYATSAYISRAAKSGKKYYNYNFRFLNKDILN